ncbi:hypothetical protein [Methanobrevibacter sp. YE315]|uniref:hypothetical protein n=1 Tax=Methanobrevibacter sp. YE315 TaxID=1609968 RepID=UPI00082D1217|nr:hypothetical protein [Methanobrevibacter sp. YE315]
MFGQEIKEPKLNFTNKVEEFYGADDDKFSMGGLFGGGRNTGEETICKVQTVHNLKKLKKMFDNVVQRKDNCISPVGYRCYLFLDNDEIKIKTIKNKSYDRMVNTSLGLITCQDKGEWGGSLILITDDGQEYHFDSFSDSFEDIFEYDCKVYAISSLAHLFGRECALHEIKRSNGKYQIATIFKCDDMYFSGYYVDENYLYFYSNEHYNGLCRFNLDNNQLEIIHTNLCPSIEVNSLIKQDNFIYIHGNYNIIKYDLTTRGIVSIYTNLEYDEISEFWFVNEDVKLRDVWDELIIKEE